MNSNASSRTGRKHAPISLIFPVCLTVVAFTAMSPTFAVLSRESAAKLDSTARASLATATSEAGAAEQIKEQAFVVRLPLDGDLSE